jgi:predicted Rdx family selenoprotein
MNPKSFEKYNLTQLTIPADKLYDFVSGVYQIQHEMTELLISSKQRQGFPEATKLINRIRGL